MLIKCGGYRLFKRRESLVPQSFHFSTMTTLVTLPFECFGDVPMSVCWTICNLKTEWVYKSTFQLMNKLTQVQFFFSSHSFLNPHYCHYINYLESFPVKFLSKLSQYSHLHPHPQKKKSLHSQFSLSMKPD